MGRAERRAAERAKRIQNNKESIKMTRQDIRNMEDGIIQKTINLNADILMTCFALVLHDVYGFGRTRILKTLGAVDGMFGKVLDDELTMEDMKKRLEEETGVVLRC